MLQQTQVSRVKPAYARFVRRFGSLQSLARASLGEVLRLWSGLGYNRRARDLQRIARASRGGLPRDVSDLDALPGIGAYTAAAVACFAHGQAVAFADTNIRRVLGRALQGRTATEHEARKIDGRLMSRRAPGPWHHALMDLGATICVARRPRCNLCPLRASCRYRGGDDRTPRKQTLFASSDRRIRGAIVRVLGDRPHGLSVDALTQTVADARVRLLVPVLKREGLIEIAGSRVRLPTR